MRIPGDSVFIFFIKFVRDKVKVKSNQKKGGREEGRKKRRKEGPAGEKKRSGIHFTSKC